MGKEQQARERPAAPSVRDAAEELTASPKGPHSPRFFQILTEQSPGGGSSEQGSELEFPQPWGSPTSLGKAPAWPQRFQQAPRWEKPEGKCSHNCTDIPRQGPERRERTKKLCAASAPLSLETPGCATHRVPAP